MKETLIVRTSAAGLVIGCILGMVGSLVPLNAFRSVAWSIGSAGIILAGSLLTMYYFRRGYDFVAAGFLILCVGEAVVFSSCATSPADNVPAFGAGVFLWALAIALLSVQKIYPLFVRCTGVTAAILFIIVAISIFIGHPLDALAKPLPFYAYPFYAATLVGWSWTLLKTNAVSSTQKKEKDSKELKIGVVK